MQPDHAQPHPLLFLRRNWWPVAYVATFSSLALYQLLNGNAVGWWTLAIVGLFLGLHWLDGRTSSRLDRATGAALAQAIRAQPERAVLVDRETDDIFRIARKRFLGAWRVERLPDGRRISEEIEEDFAAGRLSTIPWSSFFISKRRISVHDGVMPVQVGDGGAAEPYSPPGAPRRWLSLVLRLRTGSGRVSARDVAALLDQLRRAEPIHDEPEDEHAAA